ncbi:GGDEF domain-containing protein [Streptomyces piniterrae]|uniref:GGDEF domain-containing protein n=1 Tax=Streptomyces piniterrae TaxID=2571125 RepID=A0A4U0NNR7_9ACTN|nr:GGDEF domain-containing protein [Streptomyces piniterrae]
MTLAAASGPLAAGWSLHALRMRRRIESARRDPLTGLWTRDAFDAKARRRLARSAAAVVVIDLDGFKALNDTYGHAAGDAALAHTGRVLADRVRLWGLAARLGGDEFALILPATAHDVRTHMGKLHTRLVQPFDYEGTALDVGSSIGAVVTEPGADLSAALRRADEAMYAAKRTGGGWFVAVGLPPALPTVNGRRAGRPGTGHAAVEGGAS